MALFSGLERLVERAVRSAMSPVSLVSPDELIRRYLAQLRFRVRPRHLLNRKGQLARVLAACQDLTGDQLAAFRDELVRSGRCNRTANNHLSAIRACLAWGVRSGLWAANFAQNVSPLPVTEEHWKKRRRAMRIDEEEAFLAHQADLDQWRAHPQVPLFRTLLEVGSRRDETALLPSSALAGDSIVYPPRRKGGRSHVAPISESLQAMLRARASSDQILFRTPDGMPWKPTTTGNILRTFLAGLRAVGILQTDARGMSLDVHALRTTAVTRMLDAGVPTAIVARALGHQDERTTLRNYARLETEQIRRHLLPHWQAREARTVGAPPAAAQTATREGFAGRSGRPRKQSGGP